jgi:hypothetical protein
LRPTGGPRFVIGEGKGSDGIFVFQEQMTMIQSVLDKTKFLNVDLRIYSKLDLQPLVDAMGKKIIALYVGRERRMYKAQLELAVGNPKSPESAIRGYCKLIQELPAEVRKLWNTARSREFDVGIGAPERMQYYWFSIAPTVIKAASEIDAYISVTVYGPMKRASKLRKVAPPI